MRFRLLAAGVTVSVLAACGGESTGPNSTANIGGTWQVVASISNAGLQLSCTASGVVSVSESGQNFTGQVSGSSETCTGPGGSISDTIDGPLTGGQISGSSVSYSDGDCTYTGSMTGDPVNLIKGPVSCTIPIQGQNYQFTGTWQISR
jgi:hypothetical protein